MVESRRIGRRVVQQHVLYLGEVSDRQRASWERAVSVFDETSGQLRQLSLIPEDRPISESEVAALPVRLSALRLERPRQWGACWLADSLWRELHLDTFFAEHLGCSREDTAWEKVLRSLTIYRLISPGSEWRLHRHWFATTALPDLLDTDASVAQPATLYRCHDRLLEHKEALFAHLRERWTNLFAPSFDILLYDLTSTYFECDVPEDENDPRRFGYSRDRRSDCVQVVIALVVTPEGLPLAYEMLPGNTADKTTLPAMIALLKKRHGKIGRIWVMDRGIPTEDSLAQMRAPAIRPCIIWSARPRRASTGSKPPSPNAPGWKCADNCASKPCPRTARFMSSPKVPPAWTRSARCAGVPSKNIGGASANSRN